MYETFQNTHHTNRYIFGNVSGYKTFTNYRWLLSSLDGAIVGKWEKILIVDYKRKFNNKRNKQGPCTMI